MTLEHIKVLLAEDNPADARWLRAAVSEAGTVRLELVQTMRLDEALTRLHDELFDVVLLDLGLPDSQGLDTFQRVHREVPAVPVVVLSGIDDETVAIQAVHEGAQDYLIKGRADGPLVVKSVRYAIERHLLIMELMENVAKRKRAEETLQRIRSGHVWGTLSRTLGRGAAAVLYQAGIDAGSSTYDFIQENWKPANEEQFLQAMKEYFELAGFCDIQHVTLDRPAIRLVARVARNFEAVQSQRQDADPVCHFLRGQLCGVAGRLLGVPELVAEETICEANGGAGCEFVVHVLFK